jgi:hypothetical protein
LSLKPLIFFSYRAQAKKQHQTYLIWAIAAEDIIGVTLVAIFVFSRKQSMESSKEFNF